EHEAPHARTQPDPQQQAASASLTQPEPQQHAERDSRSWPDPQREPVAAPRAAAPPSSQGFYLDLALSLARYGAAGHALTAQIERTKTRKRRWAKPQARLPEIREAMSRRPAGQI